jgi:ABC-type transport system involved in multi-copper enzyme maturation permease subunit
MTAPPKIGFLGRTFGWTGSRHEWLLLGGFLAWAAVGFAIYHQSRRLTTGETVLLAAAWLLALGVVARDAVRNLFGPVFFHDVVRLGRRSLTFWLRFLYCVIVGFVLCYMYFWWLDETVGYFRNPNPVVGTSELSRFGTQFFQTFAVLQFLAMMVLTPVYVGGTICVEKERKTLEFLLATDLRNREIIFGKLASRVLNLLMYVLVGLPVLAFTQLFGGVDPEQLFAVTVATFVTVIGLSALAIWFSTMMKKSRDAIMMTYLTYAAYLVATFFGAAWTNIAPWKGWWNTPLQVFGVSFGVNDLLWQAAQGNIGWHVLVMSAPRGMGMAGTVGDQLTGYVVFWFLATTLLLTYAIVRLRPIALNQAYGSPGGTKSRKAKAFTADGPEKVVVNEAVRTHPEVGDNPVFWKEVFVDVGMRGGWRVILLAVLILFLLLAPLAIIVWQAFVEPSYYGFSFDFAERWYRFTRSVNVWARVMTGILTTLILFAAAIRGAGAISGEKDKDTWISLLGTPLSADEILMSKWWGCILGLRRAFFVLLAVWAIGLFLGAVNPLILIPTAAVILLYTAGFSWIGLYFSMTARNTTVATVRAFFAALFFAGGFWILVVFCCILPMPRMSRDFEAFFQTLLGITPPFVAGWMPMLYFDREDLGPFHHREEGIGVAAPIIGTLVWLGFTVFLTVACRVKFRKLTNRDSQELPDAPPRVAEKKNRYE